MLGIFAGPVLNNSGQIAFMAGLADGRAGLYIATPSPEPSSLVLATLGLVGLFGYAWRMRRRK
ncbi:MAG: PEP-CTERM sorting domain-containing protein [Planctomycetia bacterium]|nr:PEP-CTERM sorting domain-containing protein [Planctomycetia bacterium]